MSETIPALVNPKVLSWARAFMRLEDVYVAEKAGIEVERLRMWEAGSDRPSIAQLRKIANLYQFSIAVFYLPNPPTIGSRRIRDRRFLPGSELEVTSPELSFEFRKAEDRREIVRDLLRNVGRRPKPFGRTASLRQNTQSVAHSLREFLGITYDEQVSWRDPRFAFNAWRKAFEDAGVLVFQAADVPLRVMRGYSMFFEELPIIGVNRKDSCTARSFSLLHEAVHLMLRTGSLCDMHEVDGRLGQSDRRIEVFCNRIAGEALVPGSHFLAEHEVIEAQSQGQNGDRAIASLARTYSASREVVVRRMLDLGLVTEDFYRTKREEYSRENPSRSRPQEGFMHPVANAVSTVGRPLIGLALENLHRGTITTADFCEYVGVKIKHLDRIRHGFLLG